MYICYCPLRDPNWNKNIVLYCIVLYTLAGAITPPNYTHLLINYKQLLPVVSQCTFTITRSSSKMPYIPFIIFFIQISSGSNTIIDSHFPIIFSNLFVEITGKLPTQLYNILVVLKMKYKG